MVINSTNINKTIESLNSECHQFHKYQQNKQSPLIINEYKKTMIYDVGNSGPGFGQIQKCGGAKPINGILPS